MSLGSGFSYQGIAGHSCGGRQFSTVKVNDRPAHGCAGNFDDGLAGNGALITVGGVGDSTNNPTDATSTTSPTGEDDELYNLKPLMQQGDATLTIDTENPSGDDNLFLAVISVTAQASVTTEVCNDGIDNDGDGFIDQNDPDCISVQLASNTYSVNEAAGPASIGVTLTTRNGQPTTRTVTADVVTSNGSATSPADYAGGTRTVTFAPGVTSATASIPIVNDNLAEGDETVNLTLGNPTNAVVGSPSAATLTIVDDDTGDHTPPVCALATKTDTGITVRTNDSGSGLASIVVNQKKNANVTVPPFAQGTTSDVIVTRRQDQAGRLLLGPNDRDRQGRQPHGLRPHLGAGRRGGRRDVQRRGRR